MEGHELESENGLCFDHSGRSRDQKRHCLFHGPLRFALGLSALSGRWAFARLKKEKKERQKEERAMCVLSVVAADPPPLPLLPPFLLNRFLPDHNNFGRRALFLSLL